MFLFLLLLLLLFFCRGTKFIITNTILKFCKIKQVSTIIKKEGKREEREGDETNETTRREREKERREGEEGEEEREKRGRERHTHSLFELVKMKQDRRKQISQGPRQTMPIMKEDLMIHHFLLFFQ